MKQQIITMLELQDAMNIKVHPEWRKQNFPWYRAIWTECAELLEHYGWKWWKKQQPDMPQVQLELVDIWHFGLSILLLGHDSKEAIAEQLCSALETVERTADFKVALEQFTLATLEHQSFDSRGFMSLLNGADMTFDELYTRYVGKNMLNLFRQDFGYQDGSYQKQWQGREDNEYLVDIIASIDHTRSDFKDVLYQHLKKTYLELKTVDK